jgi:hypothetical protein
VWASGPPTAVLRGRLAPAASGGAAFDGDRLAGVVIATAGRGGIRLVTAPVIAALLEDARPTLDALSMRLYAWFRERPRGRAPLHELEAHLGRIGIRLAPDLLVELLDEVDLEVDRDAVVDR